MSSTTFDKLVRPIARRVVAAAGVALALCGCDAGNGGERATLSTPATRGSVAQPRALCTARAEGTSHLDATLREQERRAAKNPESPEPWLALGATWMSKARVKSDPGFYLNADACVDAALALSSRDRGAKNLRGLVFLNDHRFRDARAIAREVLAEDGSDPTAWGTLSDAELELGDIDESERAAQRMLDAKPSLASYARGAYLTWLRGDVTSAKVLGAQAIRAGRENEDREPMAWAIVQAALVFWNEGDYAGADRGFDLALSEFPDYPPALAGKGRVALAGGRYAEAAARFERAHARAPLVETAWLLGEAKQLAGDVRGAEAAFATVVASGRRHDQRTLSLFLSSFRKNPEEAERLARAELASRPGPYTKDALAWALYRRGAYAEARALSEEVVSLGVPDARLLFHAGAIRIANGDASGKDLVRRALRLNPSFDVMEAGEARGLLAHEV
jgi:tetratricopeptide (TPR) repeat protein